MDNKDINWEERRYWTATILLSGLCGNYHHPYPSSLRAKDAVFLADNLISILTGIPLSNLSTELYQRENEALRSAEISTPSR